MFKRIFIFLIIIFLFTLVRPSAGASEKQLNYDNLSVLEGRRIAVTTGTTHPQIAAKFVPTAELVYFDSTVDSLLALKEGKVDATCTGIPLLKNIMTEDDSLAPFG